MLDFRRLKVWAVPPQPSWVRGAVERGIVEPAEQQAAQAVEDAAQRVEDAAQRVEEARAELDELRGAVSAEQARLESLRQGARAIERDVAELEAVASLAERFDRAGRFEKRGILDSIAARCDGLRGRVEQVVDGIRGAVGRAEMAIADLARKLGPRSARMTTRALKRDLAALEKDMSPRAQALEATRAARARDENRDDRPPQRSWGQSR